MGVGNRGGHWGRTFLVSRTNGGAVLWRVYRGTSCAAGSPLYIHCKPLKSKQKLVSSGGGEQCVEKVGARESDWE